MGKNEKHRTQEVGLNELADRMGAAVTRTAQADQPVTDAPRKVPTRDLHDIEEIDDVEPDDE